MKRGSVIKRGKNWLLKFDLERVNGRRQQRYEMFYGTKAEAWVRLRELLHSADKGTLPEPSAQTVGKYLRGWLDTAHEQSPKTLERYRELAARQIIPHLGSTKLQKLKPEHVQAWHRALLDSGLAPRTIGHAHRLLSKVLGIAVKNGTLIRNVAGVHRPPKAETTELEILTPEQVKTVLAALEGHDLFPLVSLALATGMRRGELLGVQWGDIDLDGGALRVERAVEETNAGLRLKAPKTKRGRRNITLPPEAVAMLRDRKVAQMQLRLVGGAGKLEASTLVFENVEGKLRSPRAVSRAWRRFTAREGLRKVTFHALRHTHVSMLIHKRVDVLTVSRRIGHSNASVTLDVYGHLVQGADAAAANAIEGLLK
jgi:integrase